MSTPIFDRRTFVKIAAAAGAGLSARAFAQSPEGFKLPDLPYAFGALEPHIDAKTMEIHHGKHHAAYINNLNAAIEANKELQGKDLDGLIGDLPAIRDEALRNTVRNNGGGHWNHTFFWESLAPAGKGGEPSKDLADAITAAFGSFDDFKKAFADAAAKRFGSGWAWLIRQDDKLKIVSTPNQDTPFMHGIVPEADIGSPLLGLDVWEHAYYLHYQNRRPDYVTAWWNVVDWNPVSKRLAAS